MLGRNDKGRASGGGGRRDGDLSFIAPDVTITGNIGGRGTLHIDGRIDGDVQCASITLGASGAVTGHISADSAQIAGTIDGTLAAKSVVIEATARINGDLSYETVSIAAGAAVEGRVNRLSSVDANGALKLVASE